MLRILIAVMLVVAVGMVLAPQLTVMLSWVLAFLILLMLGDLVLSPLRKRK